MRRLQLLPCLSFFLLALSHSPSSATTITSTAAGGNWSAPGTWVGGAVPTASDSVLIDPGATVTIDTSPTVTMLQVGVALQPAATLQFEQTTARTLTVTGDVTVLSSNLRANPAGTQTGHQLIVEGSLGCAGVVDFSTNGNLAAVQLTFTGAHSDSIYGSGTLDLRTLTVDKGTSAANILDVTKSFTVQGTNLDGSAAAFLTLLNGTLKLSGSGSYTGRTFATAGYSIPATAGFWLDSSNYTVSAQASSATCAGLLRVSKGFFNVGTAADHSLQFPSGSRAIVEGGVINAAGRFGVNTTSTSATFEYVQTGGTVNVCRVGNTSGTFASFDLGRGNGPDPIITGGAIICQNAATGALISVNDYRNEQGSSASGITGGLLQFGNHLSGSAHNFHFSGNAPSVMVSNAGFFNHIVGLQTPTRFNTSLLSLTVSAGTTFTLTGNQSATFPALVVRGTTVTNSGTISATTANARVVFTHPGAIGWSGTGIVQSPLTTLEMSAPGGTLVLSQTNNIVVRHLRLIDGGIANANKLTIGQGNSSTNSIQIGNTTTPTTPGILDAAPTFNLGTGTLSVLYGRMTGDYTMGNEIPPLRTVTSLTYDDDASPFHSLSLSGDITTATLALTNGHIVTGANQVIVTGATTRSTGLVDGFLQKAVPNGTNVTVSFEVGDDAGYTPVSVTFEEVGFAGSLIARSAAGDHADIATSGIDPAQSVNRHWSLDNSGIGFTTASATFTFLPSDVDGGATFGDFVTMKYDEPSWAATGDGGSSATTATATGLTSFSDFQIGEPGGSTAVGGATFMTRLSPVFPNPVRRTATLEYSLALRAPVDLAVYSVDGRRVKTLLRGVADAGPHRLTWSGTDDRGAAVEAGIYFLRLETPGLSRTRRIALIR